MSVVNPAILNSSWNPITFNGSEEDFFKASDQQKKDEFKELFENHNENLALLINYIIGLFGCLGLCLISWFERSGQAGPFRSLVNQLVSIRYDQLSMLYIFGGGPLMLRRLYGPLSWIPCRSSTFFGYLAVINSLHLSLFIAVAKFIFIFKYKSVPIMDDKLLTRVIMIVTFVWGILAVSAKLYLDETVLITEQVCLGFPMTSTAHGQASSPRRQILLLLVVACYCFISMFFLTLAIKWKKSKINIPQQSNHYNNGSNMINLSPMIISWIVTCCCFLMSIGILYNEK